MGIEIDYGIRVHGDLASTGNAPEDFMDRSLTDQLFLSARSQNCPVPLQVVKDYAAEYALKHPEITDPTELEKQGMMMAIRRYCDTNSYTKVILEIVAKINPELHENLVRPVPRLPGEKPNPNLDPEFLPPDFDEKMKLASTPYGYAMSRLLICQGGEGRGPDGNRTQDRMLKGMDIVEETASSGVSDPIIFMLEIAEKFTGADADPERMLYHMMSAGILGEEGCKTMYRKIINLMPDKAPTLWSAYQEMLKENGAEGMKAMGIIIPQDLE